MRILYNWITWKWLGRNNGKVVRLCTHSHPDLSTIESSTIMTVTSYVGEGIWNHRRLNVFSTPYSWLKSKRPPRCWNFVRGNHRWLVNSPHTRPVMWGSSWAAFRAANPQRHVANLYIYFECCVNDDKYPKSLYVSFFFRDEIFHSGL